MQKCPCGSGRDYDECCGPYISGTALPPTAEALMRARYSAYAVHDIGFIIDTCDREENERIDEKETRDWSEKSKWLGLTITGTEKGGASDSEGVVTFEAAYERDGLRDTHREKARFKKQDGRWWYVDGEIAPVTVVRATPKVGRNEPCPCGSGKKYKFCHGR
jgi:SEC-C motif-containing protein